MKYLQHLSNVLEEKKLILYLEKSIIIEVGVVAEVQALHNALKVVSSVKKTYFLFVKKM
jgi:hypothetical protein